jgi:CRISPR-associated endonuclease Cas1
MEAHQTVPEVLRDRKSLNLVFPRHGVLTTFGYGIRIYVERGHLTIEDGIGADRRKVRLPRVGHGLRRLVLIGSDGFISLSAIRWLADQDACFVMLERDGSVLATTGPVHPSDARLRRAQSLAHQSGMALHIAKELIRRKLIGQETVVRTKLPNPAAADAITQAILALGRAESIDTVRELEARAANAYWLAWRDLPVRFPSCDLGRVPDHWQKFGTRKSPLTGSQRLAVNPPNAMLNYGYAILESESRLALAALGLDPGIGVLHVDSPSRDSLASDLMEVGRPDVDAYVFDWITRQPLRREWFFEQRDGNCRLVSRFAAQLSETSEMWKRTVGPVAEWISHTLWSTMRRRSGQIVPATRLTQSRRRISKGVNTPGPKPKIVRPPNYCRNCGKPLRGASNRTCGLCAVAISRSNLREAAKLGRIITHLPKAQALRAATQRKHAATRRAWNPLDVPDWLNARFYRDRIQPGLANLTVPTIGRALDISEPYASEIRKGRVPHLRHWLALAELMNVTP